MPAPGVVYGLAAFALPYIVSKIAGGSLGSGGLITRGAAPPPQPQQPQQPQQGQLPRVDTPPNTMPLLDPWEGEPAAPPPPPPPPAPAAPSSTPATASNPIQNDAPIPTAPRPWDGPDQSRLPTEADIRAVAPPEAPPAPPPPPGPAALPQLTPAQLEARAPAASPAPPPPAPPAPPAAPVVQVTTAPPPPAAAPPQSAPAAGPPVGFDAAKARSLAKQVAANVTNKKYNYARDLLRQFQGFAGINVDGVYGGASKGALEAFGVRRPPNALFAPTATQPYPWTAYL